MILVDKDIEVFVTNGSIDGCSQTAIKGGRQESVTNIGYDLTTRGFPRAGKMVESVKLNPGESTFVESLEIVAFDNTTVGRPVLKNSRIRMGLTMDAPTYQPGHETRIYFRLTNVSNDLLELSAGEKYVTLIFEQLEQTPNNPYNGTFQDEFDYKGLADYKSSYMDQIQSIDGKVKDLENIEKNIYINVLSILSIFVAVFTLLNVNISLSKASASVVDFLIFNLSTIGSISALALLLGNMLWKKKAHGGLWTLPAACFILLIIIAVCVVK